MIGARLLAFVCVGVLVAVLLSGTKQHRSSVVVIVGGGLSGLCAAVEAQAAGVESVVLLEQETVLGGNSRLASSGLNGADTPAQRRVGIHDSVALFRDDTLRSGRGREQSELVERLVLDSASSIAFLEQQGGLNLSVVTLLGGQQRARTHRAYFGSGRATNVGLAIIQAMEVKVRTLPNVQIRTGTRVTRLLSDKDHLRVTGVELENGEHLLADSVILTTGGYSTDRDGLLTEYTPHLKDMPSTNGVWKSAGDGVRFGRQLGAQLSLMDAVRDLC